MGISTVSLPCRRLANVSPCAGFLFRSRGFAGGGGCTDVNGVLFVGVCDRFRKSRSLRQAQGKLFDFALSRVRAPLRMTSVILVACFCCGFAQTALAIGVMLLGCGSAELLGTAPAGAVFVVEGRFSGLKRLPFVSRHYLRL